MPHGEGLQGSIISGRAEVAGDKELERYNISQTHLLFCCICWKDPPHSPGCKHRWERGSSPGNRHWCRKGQDRGPGIFGWYMLILEGTRSWRRTLVDSLEVFRSCVVHNCTHTDPQLLVGAMKSCHMDLAHMGQLQLALLLKKMKLVGLVKQILTHSKALSRSWWKDRHGIQVCRHKLRCDFELYNLHLCHRCWKSRAARICLTDMLWKLGSQSGCSIPTSAVLCMLGMGRQYIREYKCMLRPHSALGIVHSVRRVRGCRGPPSRSLSVGLLKGNILVSIHTHMTCISTMQWEWVLCAVWTNAWHTHTTKNALNNQVSHKTKQL